MPREARDGRSGDVYGWSYAAEGRTSESGECPGMDALEIAPAFPVYPPSLAVVCRGRMDAQERRICRMNSLVGQGPTLLQMEQKVSCQ